MWDLVAGTGRRVGAWSKEQWALVVVAVPAVSYSLLYFAYFQFYVSLGLRPSDVGLTRLRMLQESLIGLVLVPAGLIVTHALLLLAALICTAVIWIVVWRFLHEDDVPWHDVLATLLVVAVGLVALLGIVGYGRLVHDLRSISRDVTRDGRIIVSSVSHRGDLYWPYLDVQALPVDLAGPGAADLTVTRGCTLYLGQAEGQAVLLDVRTETIVRAPVADLIIVTHPAVKNYPYEHLPPECASNEGNMVS
jgi:hypothetical protein